MPSSGLYSLKMANEKASRGIWLEFFQQYEVNPMHKAAKSTSDAMAIVDFVSRVGADGHFVAPLQAQVKDMCLGHESAALFD